MDMLSGGIDIFYIDESHDKNLYVVSAIAIPMLRPIKEGMTISWSETFTKFKAWRRDINKKLNVPAKKELHGVKLAAGRGNYLRGKYPLTRNQAALT